MTELEKAARQALEVLKECRRDPRLKYEHPNYDNIITALRRALEQPADEPYGCVTVVKREGCADMHWFYRHPEPPYLDNAAECHTVYTRPQPAAPDWSNAGRLIEAAHRANGAGHLTGTSNWAASVCKYMLAAAPEQKGN